MTILRHLATVLLLSLCCSVPAQAAVLYANPPADPIFGSTLLSLSSTRVAQHFAALEPTRVTALHFYAGFDPVLMAPSKLDWTIHASSTGLPGDIIAQGSSAASLFDSGMFILTAYQVTTRPEEFVARVDLLLPGIDLGAGEYWLGLHMDEQHGAQGGVRWLASAAPTDGSLAGALSINQGLDWQADSVALAFQLDGQTSKTGIEAPVSDPAPLPEPATVMLFGLGLLGLALQLRYLQHYWGTEARDAAQGAPDLQKTAEELAPSKHAFASVYLPA